MLQKKRSFISSKERNSRSKITSFSDPLQGQSLLPSCHPSSVPLVPLPLYLTSHGEIPYLLKNSNMLYRVFAGINIALPI
jgi:hypothetical protein